jgi:hypothetical protein
VNAGRSTQRTEARHTCHSLGLAPAQRSCFTVHGKQKKGLDALVPYGSGILKRYDVDPACRQSMVNELRTLGVTDSVAFPDLHGLAKELKAQFS